MYLSATDIDWDKPIVWLNPYEQKKTGRFNIAQADFISDNLAVGDTKNQYTHGILVHFTDKDVIRHVDPQGYYHFPHDKDDLKMRCVWNYVENHIDTYVDNLDKPEDVKELGTF